MIWGQFVGDASALGAHWIYNLNEQAVAYPDGVHGFDAPRQGHYHFGKSPGDLTHYGDAALIVLESVAECGGSDPADFGSRFFEKMNPDTYGGYIDNATRGSFENRLTFEDSHAAEVFDYQQGADDDQMATISSLAPIVAAHHGDVDLFEIVTRATRVRQNTERATAYVRTHARILSELLAGRDIHSALHRVEETIGDEPAFGSELKRKFHSAFACLSKPVTDATDRLGQSCPLISSFSASLHSLLKSTDSFENSIVAVLRAGGDNAGRAAVVGSWLGAHLGIVGIPDAWQSRLANRARIEQCVEAIVDRGAR